MNFTNTQTQKKPAVSAASKKQTRKLWNKLDASDLKKSPYQPPLPLDPNQIPATIFRMGENIFINTIQCPMCGTEMSVMDDASNTCTSAACGYMGGYEIDMTPDGNIGGDGDATDTTRHGAAINPLLPESSFGNQIICRPGASPEMKFMSRISNWGAVPSHEKMLYTEFDHISTMAQNAGIPQNIIEHAFIIHKCNSAQQLYRGGNRDGVKAGSIYIACILNDCPRTPHEIAQIFRLNHKNAMFGCTQSMSMIHRLKTALHNSELGIGIDALDFSKLTHIKPSQFIARYCSQLSISADVKTLAQFVAELIEEQPVKSSSKPQSVAGGIIYYVSMHLKLGVPKSKIARLCGVSEVTIGNCYKWIHTTWPELIPPEILQQYTKEAPSQRKETEISV